MLIDSHCHLASHRFSPDEVSALVADARDSGVGGVVTLATSLDDLPANLAIATDPCVHACVGIHPCDVHHAPDDAVQQVDAHTADDRVCGIGETGLDFHHDPPDGWTAVLFRERQLRFLRHHFELATRVGLNVVIHTRDRSGHDSFETALGMYREFSQSVRAVFHCFSGSWDQAQRVLDAGGLVSFGGVVTFKKAGNVLETAKRCPAGSFMVETDAPYLAPEPHRGKRNVPAYVRLTAERLAECRGETVEELAKHTTCAAAGFFRFRSALD